MPRRPRIQLAGGVYHVTARGNRKQPTFLDPDDHRFHVWCLDRAAARFDWRVHAFVQMTNHFHMLLTTANANLSKGMQWLNGLYAQVFNDRHALTGHLFEGRFHSLLIEEEGHLLEASRYDLLNPVRAGLCDHPLAWPWSSLRATLGLVPAPRFLDSDWLLAHFAATPVEARRRYLEFVEDRLPGRDAEVA